MPVEERIPRRVAVLRSAVAAQQGDGAVVESDHPVAGVALRFPDLDRRADLPDLMRHRQIARLDAPGPTRVSSHNRSHCPTVITAADRSLPPGSHRQARARRAARRDEPAASARPAAAASPPGNTNSRAPAPASADTRRPATAPRCPGIRTACTRQQPSWHTAHTIDGHLSACAADEQIELPDGQTAT